MENFKTLPFLNSVGSTSLIYISIFLNTYDNDNLSSIIDPKINFKDQDPKEIASDKYLQSIGEYLSPHDMKRLEAYVDNLADFHLVRAQGMDNDTDQFSGWFLDDDMSYAFLVIENCCSSTPNGSHLLKS